MIDTSLLLDNGSRILLLVLDGLGGLPTPGGDLTELEAARTPNLDSLATEGTCGLHTPCGPGLTPGSGPGHLSLFGYDPLIHRVGRGVLSALGVDFELAPDDVAARGNFCTLDDQGRVTDRRAGRPPTEETETLCGQLDGMELDDVRCVVRPVREHRFLLVLRGAGLSEALGDTDPQATGRAPLAAEPLEGGAARTAGIVDRFAERAGEVLAEQPRANGVLLRGFSRLPAWDSFRQRFGLRALAVAGYPMYRGVSRLVGMSVADCDDALTSKLERLGSGWGEFDFFFVHVKKTDSAGEDGDFQRKVAVIEEFDERLPAFLELRPDVVLVTGDHSTPARLGTHSWHPVPVLLWSGSARPDPVRRFGERECMKGGLGPRIPGHHLIPLALAHAGRLKKFGA